MIAIDLLNLSVGVLSERNPTHFTMPAEAVLATTARPSPLKNTFREYILRRGRQYGTHCAQRETKGTMILPSYHRPGGTIFDLAFLVVVFSGSIWQSFPHHGRGLLMGVEREVVPHPGERWRRMTMMTGKMRKKVEG